jgi:hypothetical protein
MPYAPIDSEAGTVSVFEKKKVRKQVGDIRPFFFFNKNGPERPGSIN